MNETFDPQGINIHPSDHSRRADYGLSFVDIFQTFLYLPKIQCCAIWGRIYITDEGVSRKPNRKYERPTSKSTISFSFFVSNVARENHQKITSFFKIFYFFSHAQNSLLNIRLSPTRFDLQLITNLLQFSDHQR